MTNYEHLEESAPDFERRILNVSGESAKRACLITSRIRTIERTASRAPETCSGVELKKAFKSQIS